MCHMQNIYKEFFEAYRNFNLNNLNLINDFYKNTLNVSPLCFFNEDHIKSISEANKILFSDPEFIKTKRRKVVLSAFCYSGISECMPFIFPST